MIFLIFQQQQISLANCNAQMHKLNQQLQNQQQSKQSASSNMVLQKFEMCDPTHEKQFQYSCIKQNKVFCSKCWFQLEHYRTCQSSRCGHYQKLAHLVINRALQLKNIYYIQNMSTKFQTFQNARIKSLQLNYQITQLLKEWVEQKMPLFLLAMMNEMLHTRYSDHSALNCNKYDGICTQMLKTIKNVDSTKKPQYLESVISNFHTINHEIEGNLNSVKAQPKQFKQAAGKQDKIEQVLEYCRNNLGLLLINVKASMKDYIEAQISKLLSNFDPNIKFKGVSFPKISNQTNLFKKKQHYRNMSLNTELFSKITSKSQHNQIYNGFNLVTTELQSNAQQLLQVSKSFLKQKLFSIYSSVQTFKSSYPYKYSYPISTCLEPDQQYELLVLELERNYIKSIQSKSKLPFLHSLSIVVMGPETIVVRFMNRPVFCYSMRIYNYKKQRDTFYKKVKEVLGLTQVKQKPQQQEEKHIQFAEQPSLLQLAYSNFRIAYEQIFIGDNNEQKIFEGEKVTANRGMQLFLEIAEKWKSKAKIEIDFSMPKEEILQMIV